ncbi:MAG: mechanosensitive ion channel domain-containing protein [Candidatus Omnitrophota bacterium]|jgi:small conductance mechanosensitive channel
MKETFDKIQPYVLEYGLRLIAAVAIFIIGKWVAQLVSKLTDQMTAKSKINKTIAVFVKNMVYYTILAFVVIAALNKLGVETNSFIAVIGAAGLAVGLALQGTLANFAAGVMMIIFQPFQVGDRIETSGILGSVEEIQIFNTIMVTDDRKKVIIPNAKITGDKIVIYPKV